MINKVKILSINYKVMEMEAHSRMDNRMGNSDSKTGEIRIVKEMPDDITNETILHEPLHILTDNLGMDFKEQDITALSAGLYSFIKENPSFLDSIYAIPIKNVESFEIKSGVIGNKLT